MQKTEFFFKLIYFSLVFCLEKKTKHFTVILFNKKNLRSPLKHYNSFFVTLAIIKRISTSDNYTRRLVVIKNAFY